MYTTKTQTVRDYPRSLLFCSQQLSFHFSVLCFQHSSFHFSVLFAFRHFWLHLFIFTPAFLPNVPLPNFWSMHSAWRFINMNALNNHKISGHLHWVIYLPAMKVFARGKGGFDDLLLSLKQLPAITSSPKRASINERAYFSGLRALRDNRLTPLSYIDEVGTLQSYDAATYRRAAMTLKSLTP